MPFDNDDDDDTPTPFDLASMLGKVHVGGGDIPEGMGEDRKNWGWDRLDVSDYVLVSMDEAASALSSANSFGKGTSGKRGKPAREPRDFASRQMFINPTTGDLSETATAEHTVKVKEIRRIG